MREIDERRKNIILLIELISEIKELGYDIKKDKVMQLTDKVAALIFTYPYLKPLYGPLCEAM